MNKVITWTKDEDDDRILKDGETLRIPMQLTDANPFPINVSQMIADSTPQRLSRPGFVGNTSAGAQTAAERYRARDAALERAYLDLPPEPPVPAHTPSTTTRDGDIWAVRDRRLENAWRGA